MWEGVDSEAWKPLASQPHDMMSFKFRERTFLKAVSKMEKDIGRTTDVLL